MPLSSLVFASRLRSLFSLPALAHADYRRWTIAGAVSSAGLWMQAAVLAALVLQLSGSGAMLGMSVALQALPSVFLAPFGGVIADRFSRRNVLLVTQALYALISLAMGIGAIAGVLTVTNLLVLSLLAGLVVIVDGPASGALKAALVPEKDLVNAVAVGTATNSLGRIVGISASGVAIAALGPALASFVGVVCFVPPVLVLLALRHQGAPASGPRESPLAAVRGGIRFVARTRHLAWLLGLTFVLGALGRNHQVTMPLMIDGPLGGGAAAYALCSSAFTIGALVGAFVAAQLRRATGRLVVIASGLGAVAQLASGAAPSLISFVVLIMGVGVASVVFDTAMSSRFTTAASDAMRGRVLAVSAVAAGGAPAFGGPIMGSLAESFGARAALILAGVICLGACLVSRRGVTDDEQEPVLAPAPATPLVRVPDMAVAAAA